MADEASIRSSLQIIKGNLQYRSYPTNFTADVSGTKGPSPGAIAVATSGTDVDLSEIASPGFCRVTNMDAANTIVMGIWDGSAFHAFKDLLPGEHYVLRLSQFLGEQFETGTGTATTGTGDTLRLKAVTASCVALVEVFER